MNTLYHLNRSRRTLSPSLGRSLWKLLNKLSRIFLSKMFSDRDMLPVYLIKLLNSVTTYFIFKQAAKTSPQKSASIGTRPLNSEWTTLRLRSSISPSIWSISRWLAWPSLTAKSKDTPFQRTQCQSQNQIRTWGWTWSDSNSTKLIPIHHSHSHSEKWQIPLEPTSSSTQLART